MSDRKFVRHTFLAAVLTMSGAHASTASGFQQSQYKPGQPGNAIPQGNSAVTQELNRMFQENGQQMPSMNANELPNAAVPTQGQIRPRQTPNQLQVNTISANSAKSKQTGGSGKQSVLGRFFGKLRGTTDNSNHEYRPPVPPDDTPTAQSTVGSARVHNGAPSPIPPRSGETVRAANAGVSALPTPGAVGQRAEYIQPGSAPGFMATTGAAKVIPRQPAAAPSSRAELTGTEQKAGITTPEVSVKTTVTDEFEAPFRESDEALEGNETLDLDSLIEIPAAAPQPGDAVAKKLKPETSDATRIEQETEVSDSSFADSTAGDERAPETTDVESVEALEENPFTGVQLDTSDAQSFDSQEQTNGVDAGSFGDPAVPMEDFNANLPAIGLPSVELPMIDDEDVDSEDELIETPTADVSEAASAVEKARLRQTTEQERRQLQQRQIQARAGQTGFKGFCPVALREHRELVESSDQFTSTFGLQTYKFSSAESKAAFDSDPSRYAPAAGGNDVVVLVNSGEEQAGQLDYALWYRDRLYLFRSRETMTLFSKDPQRFASQY